MSFKEIIRELNKLCGGTSTGHEPSINVKKTPSKRGLNERKYLEMTQNRKR